jgi:hypothetical protein
MSFAVRTLAVAIPLVSVDTLVVEFPEAKNVELAPLEGAVNVTLRLGMAAPPASLMVAERREEKPVPTVGAWLLPVSRVMLVGIGTIAVGSFAVCVAAEPPPLTVAEFVTLAAALADTFTVTVIG